MTFARWKIILMHCCLFCLAFKIMRPLYDLFDYINIDAHSDSLVRNNILIEGILYVQNLLVKLKKSWCSDMRFISRHIGLEYMVQRWLQGIRRTLSGLRRDLSLGMLVVGIGGDRIEIENMSHCLMCSIGQWQGAGKHLVTIWLAVLLHLMGHKHRSCVDLADGRHHPHSEVGRTSTLLLLSNPTQQIHRPWPHLDDMERSWQKFRWYCGNRQCLCRFVWGRREEV